jgi:hypothetical protein
MDFAPCNSKWGSTGLRVSACPPYPRVWASTHYDRALRSHMHGVTRLGPSGALLTIILFPWRMASSGMLRRVALVRSSSGTSVLTRATRRNSQEDAINRSHRGENLKSYIFYFHPRNSEIQWLYSVTGLRASTRYTGRKHILLRVTAGLSVALKLFIIKCLIMQSAV